MQVRVFLLLFGLLTGWASWAHPHVWIDLRVTPQVDAQGRLVALQQAWRFDPFYSLILIEELEKGGPPEELEQRLDSLAFEVVSNLQNFDFFTQLESGNQRLKFKPVEEYNLMRVGQRIEFNFTLPLAQPQGLKGKSFRYQVYDPSYYIEILHAQGEAPTATDLAGACQVHLEEPQPSGDLVAKAMALDADETPEDPQLGLYFTETIHFDCS